MTPVCLYILFLLLLLWQPIHLVGCYLPPTVVPECTCKEGVKGLTIHCTRLNSTRFFSHLHVDTAQAVVKVEVNDSELNCLDFTHFERFYKLKDLRVTNSKLKDLMCPANRERYFMVAYNLRNLRSLDLSYNSLKHLDYKLKSSFLLDHLNLAHNELSQLSPVISRFKRLKYLNVSNNQLYNNLDQGVLESLPESLDNLDFSGRVLSRPVYVW